MNYTQLRITVCKAKRVTTWHLLHHPCHKSGKEAAGM